MRKPIIAGNWKMNNTIASGSALIKELIPLVKDAECEVAICVPYTLLPAANELVKGTNIHLGAENVSYAEKGAYTGEISAEMLKEVGVEYVIVGHSERRQYFGETDQTVNKRAYQALQNGLKPIICVGETLEERETGKTEEVLERQVVAAFEGLTAFNMPENVVVAYEPVWAIGTGKTATKEQANETIAFIRKVMVEKICAKCGAEVRIQYGGSMNAKNANELMSMPEIDGGLIGGASLKAEDFSKVVNYNA